MRGSCAKGRGELRMASVVNNGGTVGSTSPYTDAHAVVSVDFGILNRPGFSDTDVQEILESLVPHLTALGFESSDSDACDGEDLLASFHRVDSDGATLEEFHLHGMQVHVIMNEYRGWDTSCELAMERLNPIIEFMRRGRYPMTRLNLAFRDAFINPDLESYTPRDVFQESEFLPAITLSGSPYWEASVMGVESSDDGIWSSLYSRLRVEANILREAGEGSEVETLHWTEINHRQQIEGDHENSADVEWNDETVRARYDVMHQRNKGVIVSLLNPEMSRRIGLVEVSQ